jgi:hypothetical protein
MLNLSQIYITIKEKTYTLGDTIILEFIATPACPNYSYVQKPTRIPHLLVYIATAFYSMIWLKSDKCPTYDKDQGPLH